MRKTKTFLLFFLLGCTAPTVVADDALTYDRISLSVSASEEVNNDTLTATLYYQGQGRSAVKVAEKVNQMIAWGVTRAKKEQDIKVRTLDYQTHPIYQNGKLTGIWQVRQAFRLESRDAAKLSLLLGDLQEKLTIQHIGYQLSVEKRRQAEDGLTETVIRRFKQKAKLIAQQFGVNDFRIVSLNLSSSGNRGPMMSRMRSMDGIESAMAAAPPTLEAGEQLVHLGVHGVIELVRE